MLECTVPLLTEWPTSKWITVGDGSFGSDAFFLRNHGAAVTATSISSDTLAVAHANGWIDAYAAENAESLSYEDNAVDFVLCKEALHHFPRPPIGFYEMLRVARNAVVLIEPVEAAWRVLSSLKTFAKSVLRGDSDAQFEPTGNFVYRLSIREVFKMLTALGYPCFAWKGINDCYIPRLKDACANQRSAGWLLTRIGIAVQDALCSARLLSFGLAGIICFKQEPTKDMLISLKRSGFRSSICPVTHIATKRFRPRAPLEAQELSRCRSASWDLAMGSVHLIRSAMNCPICSAAPAETFPARYVTALKCSGCGHIYAQDPATTQGVMLLPDPDEMLKEFAARNARLIKFWLRSGFIKANSAVLDFGAGSGHILRSLKQLVPSAQISCIEATKPRRDSFARRDSPSLILLSRRPWTASMPLSL